MKVTERPGRHFCVFCAFMKPDWLNTYSLAVTHKVWPVFMLRVRIEVYAVWNGSCLFQHEAINVLLEATELLQASISPWIRRISFKSKSTTSDHIYLLLVMRLYTDFYAHITSKILTIGKLKTWILPTYKRLPILISPLFSPTFPGTFITKNLIKKDPGNLCGLRFHRSSGKPIQIRLMTSGGVVLLRMFWSFCPLRTCWKCFSFSHLCFSVSPSGPRCPLASSSFSSCAPLSTRKPVCSRALACGRWMEVQNAASSSSAIQRSLKSPPPLFRESLWFRLKFFLGNFGWMKKKLLCWKSRCCYLHATMLTPPGVPVAGPPHLDVTVHV